MLVRPTHSHAQWHIYTTNELKKLEPILREHNIKLDESQPHIEGEKHLFSTRKLILLGTHEPSSSRVIIKASSHPDGKNEILHEKKCRDALSKLDFAYSIFSAPPEIEYIKKYSFVIMVTAFIEETKKFLDHTNQEQFFLALKAFEAQEGVHAITYQHIRIARKLFGIKNSIEYQRDITRYIKEIHQYTDHNAQNIRNTISCAQKACLDGQKYISLYSGFLTHIDFVPHNIRIHNRTIYILDHSDIHIANKHEGWARFLNYMTLYNRTLESMLLTYIKKNRPGEEYESLRLMRIYKLTELIAHYARTLQKAEGNLYILNSKRLHFWSDVLQGIITDNIVSDERIQEYITHRDKLRSAHEKVRQKELQ